ncbi:MAG: hypothetical protein N2749_03305 [Clostridia bacterium]|nr:hypothetical protein [Clostridia bacterium]
MNIDPKLYSKSREELIKLLDCNFYFGFYYLKKPNIETSVFLKTFDEQTLLSHLRWFFLIEFGVFVEISQSNYNEDRLYIVDYSSKAS